MGQHPPDFAATTAKPQLDPCHFRAIPPRYFKACPSFVTAYGMAVLHFHDLERLGLTVPDAGLELSVFKPKRAAARIEKGISVIFCSLGFFYQKRFLLGNYIFNPNLFA
jgi:hypothetical protein